MADSIGDISTRWDDTTDTVEVRVARSWVRSHRQEIATALGDEFTLTARMERVVLVDEMPPEHRPMPDLIVTATDCAGDAELAPHALAIQEHLTALLGILLDRARAWGARSGSLAQLDDETTVGACSGVWPSITTTRLR